MNKKSIHILLIVFAVLVAGIFFRQQQVQRGIVAEDYAALDFSFEVSQAQKIILSRGGKEELTAVRESKDWRITELWQAKADLKKIEDLLSGIAAMRGELRADDPSLLTDFGIADDAAVSMTILDAKGIVLADLRVGAKRAGATSVFIRRADSAAVFLADFDLFRMLGIYGAEITEPLQARLWADLEPLDFRSTDVNRLEVSRNDGGKFLKTLQVKKGDGENQPWIFETDYGSFKIDTALVETYLRAFSSLRAGAVVDPAGNYGFENPALQIKLHTAEKVILLTVGQESADHRSRYLRVDGDDSIYEIGKFVYEDFFADDSRFFKPGLPGMDTAVVEAVTLAKAGQEKKFTAAETNAFESILQTLRTLEPAGLLLSESEKKKARSPGLDTVTLDLKDGQKQILDLGEKIEGAPGSGARYAAQLRSNPVLFSVSETDYTNLFEAIKPPEPAETNASQSAPNKAE